MRTIITGEKVSHNHRRENKPSSMEALERATGSPRVAVTWQNVVGATASGNSLTKTAANGWGNAGASSVQTASSDSFVAFTTAETHTAKAAGLSVGDTSQHDTDIDFAIIADVDGPVHVYERGEHRGQFGVYTAHDVLRVEALERVMRYYRNGALLYTSALVPQFAARVDTALFHTHATINNVQLSDFNFSNVVGVDVLSPTSLRKTVGLADQWGDSGAISTRSIKADTGYVEFQAGETTHSRMAGLSHADTNQHFTTVQFGILLPRMVPHGRAQVFENGALRFTDTVNYSTADVFRVEVIDNAGTPTVRYLKNGNVMYTSLQPVTYPLVLDTAFFHDGARLVNVSIHDTFWTNAVGAEPIGGNLFATVDASDWGSSGARSIRSIPSGNGYVEFTTSETNRTKAAGLNSRDHSPHLHDIAFAIALTADSRVYVYENGTVRGDFTDYVAGDTFRVEVAGNRVRYARNGTVFYTSTVTPTFPLFVDAALINQGATIKNATLALTPGGDIPRDPLSGYAVPLTQADWDRVFAAAGVTPKTVNQSWGLQDLTGNPVATIGAALTASTGADALRYHQPVTGWERAAVVFAHDAGQAYLFQPRTIAVGPDPTVESALMFSYARVEKPASTRRIMVIAGGSHHAMLLSMTNNGNLRLRCDDTETIGTAVAHSVVRPLFLQYDHTNGVARAYSDQESIAGTYSSHVDNSSRGFGTSNNTGSSGRQSTLLAAQFRGANAEWTEAEMRAVMHVLLPVGSTVPW
jgi:hypothetical protein